MAQRRIFFSLLVLLAFAGAHGDSAMKMTEEFSGYPSESDDACDIGSLSFSVDHKSLERQIDELAGFSDTPAPSVTRIIYSKNDILARRYIKNLMGLSGLSVREDAVGNIFGRWEGSHPELAPVATGSHIDAIPYSGKYDGVVGVLGALEAINALKRSGFRPKRSLDVIMFTSEEPTRYGISCLGSRLMGGDEALAQLLLGTVDSQNVSFIEAARSAGYMMEQQKLSSVFLDHGSYSSFMELHIEQGPILEEEGLSIGIVTAIAAPASIKVDFEGNGGHAGAVLMPSRNDAGLAAAELALAVEKHVLESGSLDTVGTVGISLSVILRMPPVVLCDQRSRCGCKFEMSEGREPNLVVGTKMLIALYDGGIIELHPGAVNSIPSKSHIEIDTRDIDEGRRNSVVKKIHQSAVKISNARGVKLLGFHIVNQDPPALAAESIISAMSVASKQLNLSSKQMISRAYHDSLFIARISPMGMIFIPCYKGYSHKPEEYSSIENISNGVKVLALTLAKLSRS